nr:hypothetical protein [Ktedonobacterales bacterium]
MGAPPSTTPRQRPPQPLRATTQPPRADLPPRTPAPHRGAAAEGAILRHEEPLPRAHGDMSAASGPRVPAPSGHSRPAGRENGWHPVPHASGVSSGAPESEAFQAVPLAIVAPWPPAPTSAFNRAEAKAVTAKEAAAASEPAMRAEWIEREHAPVGTPSAPSGHAPFRPEVR